MTLRKKLALMGASIATFILGTGAVAFASIPSSSGVISSCRLTLTGVIRVIDTASQSCIIGETALNWTQSGGARLVTGDVETVVTDSGGVITDGHPNNLTASCSSNEYAEQGIIKVTSGLQGLYEVPTPIRDGTATSLTTWETTTGAGNTVGIDTDIPNQNGTITLYLICLPVPGLPS